MSRLRAIVAFVVHRPVPLVMLWGEDGIMIYNDGYSVFAADNHLRLLGCKVHEGWPEVADSNDNVMKVGLAGGTLAYKDHVLTLNRTGMFEDIWLNLDYSPVYEDDASTHGAGRARGGEWFDAVSTLCVSSAGLDRQQEINLSVTY